MINILFPKVCGICKRIYKNEICPKCNYKLKNMSKSYIETINGESYQELCYVFKYEGIIRKTLIEYKFLEAGYLYKTFSKILLNDKKIVQFLKSYDIIIPVPVHKKRKKQRGYNQTELIAQSLCKELKISLGTNIIKKTINTKPQSTLNQNQRITNSKNVYELLNKNEIYKKRVLLMDDIFTTGSTVRECCNVLVKGNPVKIGVFVLAKD